MGEGKTVEGWDAWTADMKAKHGNGNGHGNSLAIEAARLLPTPRASRGGSGTETAALLPTPTTRDNKGANQSGDDSCLTGALLPTPTAMDSEASGSYPDLAPTLTDATVRRPVDWGKYAAAIARWTKVRGGEAPDPTEPAPKGGRRLASRFVEWMMGLDEGWVTGDDLELSRNEQLKLLGNGVVPQQAAEALRYLMFDFSEFPQRFVAGMERSEPGWDDDVAAAMVGFG